MSLRHFLNTTDLEPDELHAVIHLSQLPVAQLGQPLSGQGAALIFEKPSNRTRHSTEMAVVQLGGHPVYTRGEEIGFDTRETVEDVTQVLAGYHSILAARVFDHGVVERMAAVSSVPVVNMLSDFSHPLQALADTLTMVQEWGTMAGRTVAYVGDYNNVARSFGEITLALGASYSLACPNGYDASDEELHHLTELGPGAVEQTTSPDRAVRGAHAVHTDTWTSMGQESEKALRQEIFGRYQVSESLMAKSDQSAIFMHCLPAYRGYEVAAAVIDGPASRVFPQGHNRMHAARGLLAFLMGVQL
jgi:ornithine carbamoyltransferase